MFMKRPAAAICTILLVTTLRGPLSPDALVITKAMKATTIAEMFIEEESIRVELEIGVPDLEGFQNLLPDEFRERMGPPAEPLAERLRTFFDEDHGCPEDA